MIDQLIILAPLLVLAIVLWLLGFTGCSIIYYLDDLPQLRRLTILGTNTDGIGSDAHRVRLDRAE